MTLHTLGQGSAFIKTALTEGPPRIQEDSVSSASEMTDVSV